MNAVLEAPSVPVEDIDRYTEAYRYLPRAIDGRRQRSHIPLDHLTPRQTRIAELLAAGLREKEIARALGLSRETVKSHLSSARTRLGAKNGAHLVAIALRNGFIH